MYLSISLCERLLAQLPLKPPALWDTAIWVFLWVPAHPVVLQACLPQREAPASLFCRQNCCGFPI